MTSFSEGLAIIETRPTEKWSEKKSCGKTLNLKIRFWSFLVHDSSKEATKLGRKGPKFRWSPKLEAFAVLYNNLIYSNLNSVLIGLGIFLEQVFEDVRKALTDMKLIASWMKPSSGIFVRLSGGGYRVLDCTFQHRRRAAVTVFTSIESIFCVQLHSFVANGRVIYFLT
jgi:hypothetical protein